MMMIIIESCICVWIRMHIARLRSSSVKRRQDISALRVSVTVHFILTIGIAYILVIFTVFWIASISGFDSIGHSVFLKICWSFFSGSLIS